MEHDITLKEKFVQWLCPLVEINKDDIYFPFIDIEYDPKYSFIKKDIHYRTLKRKMKNLIKMVNKDINVVYMDIETELWNRI